MVFHLRERLPQQGRIVYGQVLRGAAYSLGSGAVSLHRYFPVPSVFEGGRATDTDDEAVNQP